MSNIYIQEPPTHGKVLLTTSVGDIDIELWSKEAPKASRNFIQLVMEGYYDGTIFHRVVKEFIVQGGDPTGTGEGGESIYGAPFKDEIHTRLRFVRRGLVAMANAGPNDNGSQFFFTFGAAAELNKKHTIFGKVVGNTLFNMLKLEEVETDENDRPLFPPKIIKGEILSNPFDDIVPRVLRKKKPDGEELKKPKSKSKATKNFNLLSFGEEAEEDEEETNKASKTMRGKSKSSHDLIDDPRLSSTPAIESENKQEGKQEGKKRKSGGETEGSDTGSDSKEKVMENVRKKLRKEEPDKRWEREKDEKKREDRKREDSDKEDRKKDDRRREDSEKEEKKREDRDGEKSKPTKSDELRKESKKLQKEPAEVKKKSDRKTEMIDEQVESPKEMKDSKKESKPERASSKESKPERASSKESKPERASSKESKSAKASSKEDGTKGSELVMPKVDMLEEYKQERQKYKELRQKQGKKGSSREEETLAMLAKFQNKLQSVRKIADDYEDEEEEKEEMKEEEVEEDATDMSWLSHKLKFDDNSRKVLDANVHDVDRYEIFDPRNPLTKRRREASKKSSRDRR